MCQCARWHLEIPLTAWALKNWWEIHYKSGIETGNICGFLPRIRARDPSVVTDSNTCTTWPRLKKCGISWFRRPNSLMRLKVPRCLEKGCWIGRESWGHWNHGECFLGIIPKYNFVKYSNLPRYFKHPFWGPSDFITCPRHVRNMETLRHGGPWKALEGPIFLGMFVPFVGEIKNCHMCSTCHAYGTWQHYHYH